MKNLVIIKDNQVVTTSMKVAELFGKRHDHVIRKINELVGSLREQEDLRFPKNGVSQEKEENLRKRNFSFSQEKGEDLRKLKIELSQNASQTAMFRLVQQNMKTPTGGIKSNPMYLMDRDGFTLLAMGFTGAKALQFKLAYIQAFNEMEAKLKKLYPCGKENVGKEIVLSDSEHTAIGGIVKRCVGAAVREELDKFLTPPEKTQDWEVSLDEMVQTLFKWHQTQQKQDTIQYHKLCDEMEKLFAENEDFKKKAKQIKQLVNSVKL